MAIELVNGFYMSGNNPLGNYSGSTNDRQYHNASFFVRYFLSKGWTMESICGMLGNMQIESSMNPALIEGNGRQYAPQQATVLTAMTNNIMLDFYKEAHPEYTGTGNPFGLGIVQWTGHNQSGSIPYGQKMVAYAISDCNNTPWYWGQNQIRRINWEQQNNGQWDSKQVDGIQWYWTNFIQCTNVNQAAHVWMVCYERPIFTQESLALRQANAQRYYTYFNQHPYLYRLPIWLISQKRRLTKNVKR